MNLARTGLMAVVALGLATVAWAQKPDFSGTWTLESSSGPAGIGSGPLGTGTATITQTTDALTIERTMGGGEVRLTYRLDGAASRNVMTDADGRPADSVSTATWDGPRLEIVTKQEAGGHVSESTQVWTVDGRRLTVESSTASGTRKHVYTK